MVVDWCIDHPEYTAKIKVIPKKDYPILMPCEFWGIHIQAKRFELLRMYSLIGAVGAYKTMTMKKIKEIQCQWHNL